MTRSSFPCFAVSVKSMPYFSRASYFPSGSDPATTRRGGEVLEPQNKNHHNHVTPPEEKCETVISYSHLGQ